MDWVFEDDGVHGGAWYWARGTDADSPLPKGPSLDTPFGTLSFSHADGAVSWFTDAGGRYWGVEVQCGGGLNEDGDDPLLGVLLMSEAWYYNLSGLTAKWGYMEGEQEWTDEQTAYVEGLFDQQREYSPDSRHGAYRRRKSHLEA